MRTIAPFALATLALGLAAGALRAQPDAFWCGQRLIREGMTATQIVRRCGEPDAVEEMKVPIMARNANGAFRQVGTKIVEYWTYDRGAHRFPARLTIDEGVAAEIELLSRQ